MPAPNSLLAVLLLTAAFAHPAHAEATLELAMPAPVEGVEVRSEDHAAYALPIGAFAAGQVPVRHTEGALDQRAYRMKAAGLSLVDLASPLRTQLEAQGFKVIFDCDTRACGGFDFRFAIEVMPEPEMHVDLGDFRFISAERGAEVVALLVSRSPTYGFVQVTRVGANPLPPPARVEPAVPAEAAEPEPVAPVAPAPEPLPEASPGAENLPDLAAQLLQGGRAALDDLVFTSGSATLADGKYASLEELADWLKADPSRQVILVGHTDASGGLRANIELSERRAKAVRQALLDKGIPASQVEAQGVGPLAPRASNETEEGRRKNRRVEAVTTSTQ